MSSLIAVVGMKQNQKKKFDKTRPDDKNPLSQETLTVLRDSNNKADHLVFKVHKSTVSFFLGRFRLIYFVF